MNSADLAVSICSKDVDWRPTAINYSRGLKYLCAAGKVFDAINSGPTYYNVISEDERKPWIDATEVLWREADKILMLSSYAYWATSNPPILVRTRNWLRLLHVIGVDLWSKRRPFSSPAALWYDTLVWEYDAWFCRVVINSKAWHRNYWGGRQRGSLPDSYPEIIDQLLKVMPCPPGKSDLGVIGEQEVLFRWLIARGHQPSQMELKSIWFRIWDRRELGTRPWRPWHSNPVCPDFSRELERYYEDGQEHSRDPWATLRYRCHREAPEIPE